MRKTLILLSIALLGWLPLKGQEYSAMSWSTLPHDAYSMGMGGITTLSCPIGIAGMANPAKLLYNEEKKVGINAGWQMWKPTESNYLYVGASYTTGIVGIALGYTAGLGPEIHFTDIGGNSTGSAKIRNRMAYASLGLRILPILSVGVTGKYISENEGIEGRRKLFAGDFFAMFEWEGARATFGLRNLSNSFTTNNIEYKLPQSLVGGVGYKNKWEDFGLELGVEYEAFLIDKANKQWQERIGGGVGLILFDFLAIRGGYNWSNNTPLPTYTSLGLGFEFEFLNIDASYLFNRDKLAGDIINVQVGIQF